MPAQPTEAQLNTARTAYQRYGAVTGFKNFQGNPMPTFDELPFVIQCAWVASANAEYKHDQQVIGFQRNAQRSDAAAS